MFKQEGDNMKRIADLSNAELLLRFEIACFRITNYPNNKKENETFTRLETEIADRLGISHEYLERIRAQM